jgi:branched-chain amino acid transport system ATP-binding protein
MTTPVFVAEALTVKYGVVAANTDVNLALTPGRVHGVIGPNGAGKSTLIDAISGRRRPTSGRVMFDGNDITAKSVRWRRVNGVARSFQRTSVFGAMTVRAQLELVARKTGENDLEQIIDMLGLAPVQDRICSEIAYGTQRSVDLAIALVGNPRVVLLDEPCAGLVADESAVLLDHVRTLSRERDTAILLVEHDVDGVFKTSDEVTVLDLGKILASGTPAEVRANPAVIKAYLGSEA